MAEPDASGGAMERSEAAREETAGRPADLNATKFDI
jgi:hypothetical protein